MVSIHGAVRAYETAQVASSGPRVLSKQLFQVSIPCLLTYIDRRVHVHGLTMYCSQGLGVYNYGILLGYMAVDLATV